MRFLRFVGRLLRNALLLLLVAGLGLWGWVEATRPDLDKLPKLQDGDLVFQTIRSHQTTAIMLASHTWLSHVGIVRLALDGAPHVVEAVGPVREIPLERWIKQGIGARLLIKRLPGLTHEQARAVLAAAEGFYGKPYDFFFLPDDDRIYCSELAYKAFQQGAGLTVGQMQKVATLDLENFAVKQLLQERWADDPLCQSPETSSYEKCLPIIKQQDIITPDAVARDPRLLTLYSNYLL